MKVTRISALFALVFLAGCDFQAPWTSDLQKMMARISEDPDVTVHDVDCKSLEDESYRCEFWYDKRFLKPGSSGEMPGMYTTKITAVVQGGSNGWRIISGYQALERNRIGD